ncbi:MAG TPA: hypothetical protein HPQ00_09435, partial [Magnetococcales bacterium]|nr:hypothetical protein [Magnetococcales bacterium]
MKTRKAWKKLGRRIPADTQPEQVEVVADVSRHLFAYHQTVSEEEYLHQFKDRFIRQGDDLAQAWDALEKRLSDWLTDFSNRPGPQIEQGWLEMVTDHERLLDWGLELAKPFELLSIPIPQPDPILWSQALQNCREGRLASILQDERAFDLAIIRRLDQQLVKEEEDHHHPFYLMPYWEYFGKIFKSLETARFDHDLEQAIRIREFHLMFGARFSQRHFTLFIGPTNSGKTYQALQKLTKASRGIYLAPLRLLALEVSETLNAWGIPCNMVTGEEKIIVEGARHSASTIEMLPLDQTWDMGVIDE